MFEDGTCNLDGGSRIRKTRLLEVLVEILERSEYS